jgi:hypothetical protein
MPNGPIAILGGSTGNGPQSIGNGKSIPWFVTRYFRRNEATTDYISHGSVTIDRIIMDVSPTAGNTGLPTGAPSVTNGVLQTIDFAYSGTISELCKNGTDYFAGIMANVEYYFGGVQIHGYDIKSNSNNIPDTVGSNDATIVNGTADQWQVYQKQTTGEWLGPELVTQSVWENPSVVGTQWSFSDNLWALIGDGSPNTLRLLETSKNPDNLRISGNLISLTGAGLAVDNNLSANADEIGPYLFNLNKSNIGVLSYQRLSGSVSATINKPSVKEVLNVS